MGKIMEIPGGGGSKVKPSRMENPVGWEVKVGKTLCGGEGGMDIFWNHTIQRKKRIDFLVIHVHVVALKVMNLWVTVPFLGKC